MADAEGGDPLLGVGVEEECDECFCASDVCVVEVVGVGDGDDVGAAEGGVSADHDFEPGVGEFSVAEGDAADHGVGVFGGGDFEDVAGSVGEEDGEDVGINFEAGGVEDVAHDVLSAETGVYDEGGFFGVDAGEGGAGGFEVADAGGVGGGADDDEVVAEPGLGFHGVAVGDEVDDGVAGVHGNDVGFPGFEGVGDDVFGAGGDELDFISGFLFEAFAEGFPEAGFDHAADDVDADGVAGDVGVVGERDVGATASRDKECDDGEEEGINGEDFHVWSLRLRRRMRELPRSREREAGSGTALAVRMRVGALAALKDFELKR